MTVTLGATTIDNAIARMQALALTITSVAIKSAPTYPVENADPFPFVATYLGSGQIQFGDATSVYEFPALSVEFHFSRVNLTQTYKQINAVAYEFPLILASDPNLNGTVSTIIGTGEQRINYTVRPFEWGQVKSQMLLFTVPFKALEVPA